MNRRQRRKAIGQPDRHPVTGQRVHDLTPTQLHQRLVTDALTGVATPLAWFVAACERIGPDPETAYQQVRSEVAALGGVMPGAPLS